MDGAVIVSRGRYSFLQTMRTIRAIDQHISGCCQGNSLQHHFAPSQRVVGQALEGSCIHFRANQIRVWFHLWLGN